MSIRQGLLQGEKKKRLAFGMDRILLKPCSKLWIVLMDMPSSWAICFRVFPKRCRIFANSLVFT